MRQALRSWDGCFRVGQLLVQAARLLLATGVRAELPNIPVLTERWGRSILQGPYYHGYKLGGGPIGIIATSTLVPTPGCCPTGASTRYFEQNLHPSPEDLALLPAEISR